VSNLDRNLDRHAELLHDADRLVVHLAELHSPDREDRSDYRIPACVGCGYPTDPDRATTWPCRTWSLLAEEVDR
jgi:hypothetical protein